MPSTSALGGERYVPPSAQHWSDAERAALRQQDTFWRTLPITRHRGKGTLPDAWRQGIGRTKG